MRRLYASTGSEVEIDGTGAIYITGWGDNEIDGYMDLEGIDTGFLAKFDANGVKY